jgi:GT2 family glycosyltransferase
MRHSIAHGTVVEKRLVLGKGTVNEGMQNSSPLENTRNERLPLASVVILNYEGAGFVSECVRTVLESSYPNLEVILVDNASTDASPEQLLEAYGPDARFTLIRNTANLFYAEGNNIGIRNSHGEFIVVLNNDTKVDSNWLAMLWNVLKSPRVGAAQPKILLWDSPDRIDNAGGLLDRFGYAEGKDRHQSDTRDQDHRGAESVFFAGGTSLAVRRKVLEQVGLFDPKFVAYSEDVDLSWRIRLAGYSVVCARDAVIYHRVSRTVNAKSNKVQLLWHIRKNRLAILFKNYGTRNLLIVIPVVLFFYLLTFVKELAIDRAPDPALTSLRAILWNLREMPYLAGQRKRIQRQIRLVSDSEITSWMLSYSIAVREFVRLSYSNGNRHMLHIKISLSLVAGALLVVLASALLGPFFLQWAVGVVVVSLIVFVVASWAILGWMGLLMLAQTPLREETV